MENPNTNSRLLLSYLFVTYKRPANHHSPLSASATTSLSSLSLEKSLSSNSSPSDSDQSEIDVGESESSVSSVEQLTDEEKIELVLQVLREEEDEEEKPEKLAALLASLLSPNDYEPINLEPLVLSLLHRYREDINPSGQPLQPLPSASGANTPTRPSVSRSSSFRRGLPLGMAQIKTQGAPLTKTISSSSSTFSTRMSSPNASPWSSPRLSAQVLGVKNNNLSAGALEFKFSPGASEFRPGSASGVRSRNSPQVTAQQAQATWAFTSSPLGTPKYHGSPTSSVHSNSYFNNDLLDGGNGAAGFIPRLPWAEPSGEENGDGDENPYLYGEGQEGGNYDYYVDGNRGGANTSWDPFESNSQEMGEGFYDDGEYQGNLEASGLGSGLGNYLMTPFDVLHSIFSSSSEISASILEEALVMTSWDIDAAIEYILESVAVGTQASAVQSNLFNPNRSIGLSPMNPNSAPSSPMPQARIVAGSGSRPLVMSRDTFDGYNQNRSGGNGSSSNGIRWQGSPNNSRPGTPNSSGGGQSSADQRGVGGRVCRYYLSGACLRSDCHFSHDVGKAVCKFWLRGHCLKGERGGGGGSRCDFLHSIPPVMRADFEERARIRSEIISTEFRDKLEFDGGKEAGPDLDFPSLGDAPRTRPGRVTTGTNRTATRFSSAVKSTPIARPIAAFTENTYSNPPPPQAKISSRITLRAPILLPTITTGVELSKLYTRYRNSFLTLGSNRNKCLQAAADCWKRGDGKAARQLSKDAQEFNKKVIIEGAHAARSIIEERNRLMRTIIVDGTERRGGSVDEVPDRKLKGKEIAGGICLGVISTLSSGNKSTTIEERTEIALDLHGLHGEESIGFVASFLNQLEKDLYRGLCFIVVGKGKHSGSEDAGRATTGRLRLEAAVTEFLIQNGYANRLYAGVICVDALR